jgi:site-specific recombinase XerD
MKTATARRLGIEHFSALRAALQGVDERRIGEMYLYLDGTDPRSVRATLRWVREAVLILARDHGDTDLIRALADAPSAAGTALGNLPSFDEFAADRGMTGFSMRDIELAYNDTYSIKSTPHSVEQARHALDALITLQTANHRPPAPSDAVAAWFSQSLAERLNTVGIERIRELIDRLDLYGDAWHRKISGIGRGKAQRIEQWLHEHLAFEKSAPSSVVALGASADFSAPATFNPPTSGINRAAGDSTLGAETDWDAARVFLRGYTGHTLRAYRATLERLAVWSVSHKQKSLSDLTIDDALEYGDFLFIPDRAWVSAEILPRAHRAWKPLRTATPSPATVRRAIMVLKAFGTFLVAQQYWRVNVFATLPLPRDRSTGRIERALLPHEWQAVTRYLDALDVALDCERVRRVRVVMALAIETGLRCAELVTLTCSSLYQENLGERLVWFVHIVGKGGRARDIPLNEALMQLIGDYLSQRGWHCDPRENADTLPIIAQLGSHHTTLRTSHQDAPMTPNGLYKLVKKVFAAAATGTDGHTRQRLTDASTHWLRHTFCTTALERGVALDVVQEIAGHADINLTRKVYAKTRKARLAAAMLP